MIQLLLRVAMVAFALVGLGELVSEAFATAAVDAPIPMATPAAVARVRAVRNPFVLDPSALGTDASLQAGGQSPASAVSSLQVIGVVSGAHPVAILGGATGGSLHVGDRVDPQRTVTAITVDAVRLSDGSIIPVDPFGGGAGPAGQPYLVPSLTPPSAGETTTGTVTTTPVVTPVSPQIEPATSVPPGSVVSTPPPPYGSNAVPSAYNSSGAAAPTPTP